MSSSAVFAETLAVCDNALLALSSEEKKRVVNFLAALHYPEILARPSAPAPTPTSVEAPVPAPTAHVSTNAPSARALPVPSPIEDHSTPFFTVNDIYSGTGKDPNVAYINRELKVLRNVIRDIKRGKQVVANRHKSVKKAYLQIDALLKQKSSYKMLKRASDIKLVEEQAEAEVVGESDYDEETPSPSRERSGSLVIVESSEISLAKQVAAMSLD